MRRLPLATACLLLAACSAPEARPGQAFGAAVDDLVAPAPPAAPSTETAPATEAELRDQLAKAVDPTVAALQLVRQLDDEERLPEALAVLEQALERRPSEPSLEVARAGVLRDLGRRHLAAAALQELVAREGAGRVHPGLLFELAELQYLEGEVADARSLLATIESVHAGNDWLRRSAGDLRDLHQQLDAGNRPHRLRARDLLGNLRGAPDARERVLALEELLPLGGLIAARAQAIAAADAAAAVRASAVRLAVVDAAALPELVAMALADPAPLVRTVAAARSTSLPATAAIDLLLPTLAAETDAATFVALNGALRTCASGGPELTIEAAADPAARSAVVATWRQRWAK